MKILQYLALALFAALPAFAQNGRIQYVPADGFGVGDDEPRALREALLSCISQVNGIALDSKQYVESLSVMENSQSYVREAFQEQISQLTKGVVASYTIVSVAPAANSKVRVDVSAKIAKYDSGIGAGRLRIVVAPFSTAAESYVLDNKTYTSADVSRMIGQAMVNKLVATRKFTVLDRDNSAAILSEKSLLLNENCPVEEMCKIGRVLTADYIVVGVVESLTYSTQTAQLRMANMTSTFKDIGAAVAIRIIDVATKQVKFSDIINTKMDIKEGEMAAIGLFEALSEKSVKKIMDSIYPMRVLALEDDEVVVNLGGDSVAKGERYEMFAMGPMLYDPYTKEAIGRKESKCGVIEIVRVKGKTSDARVVEGLEELQSAISQGHQIVCRHLKPKEGESFKRLSERKDIVW